MALKNRNQAIFLLGIVLVLWGMVFSVVDASSMQVTIAERAFSDEFGPILTESGFVIPLELATLFGADVSRQGSNLIVRMGQTLFEMEPGSPSVRIGSGIRQLPAAPIQLGGSFYVPLTFFGDFLGLKLSWNTARDTLDISTWSPLGGTNRQHLAAFRTIDEALQMIEEARQQIAPEHEGDDNVDASHLDASEVPAATVIPTTDGPTSGASLDINGGSVSSPARSELPKEAVAPSPSERELFSQSSPEDDPSTSSSSSTNTNVTLDGPSQSTPVSARLTMRPSVSSHGGPDPQTSSDEISTSISDLTVEMSALEIAAAIARLLAPERDRDVEPISMNTSTNREVLWPNLQEWTGVSMIKEFVDGQDAYRLDAETDVTLSTSMLVNPFRLIVDLAGIKGHSLELPLNDTLVERIRAVDHDGQLRLIFDLKVGVGHTLLLDGERGGTIVLNRPLYHIAAQTQDDGGRVWLDVDPSTPFTITRLPDPDRWMMDLQGVTVLAPERLDLSATSPLASVRSAQFVSDVGRVVLDLNKDIDIEVVREQDGIAIYYGDRVYPVAYRAVDQREMHVSIHHALVEVSVFRLLSPDRLVVDVHGLTLPGPGEEHVFMQGPVSRLRVSQYDDVTARIVADLRHHVAYGIKHDEDRTVVVMRQPTLADRVIVLDAGHGGIDGGAVGRKLGVLEKDVNLDVTFRVAKLVEELEGVPLLTRTDDAFHDLWSRPRMANEWEADVFVSIHSNTAEIISPTANGTEVYVKTDEPEDMLLGQRLLEGLVSALGTRDRGVRENRYLVVRNAAMPAALVEVAFLSDEIEEELLSEPWFRQRAAEGILNGLLRYFNREERLSEDDLASLEMVQTEWTSMGGNDTR